MASFLSNYIVMQQNQWSGRRFFSAQDRRTGQILSLIEEPARGAIGAYQHPALPHVEVLANEGSSRWLACSMPEGESLEDLRAIGQLSERDMVNVLVSVVDALTNLAALEPPLVPAYLDPACIKRDKLGRWTLDYLMLAHAPEARMSSGTPLGVYPFGVLLYWLITGQTARRTRVQVTRIQQGVSATLQFIVIRCLGRSYPSLAELRADLERAGNEHEFRALAQKLAQARERTRTVVQAIPHVALPETVAVPASPAQSNPISLEYRKVPIGGPYIPANDRPWALPPRPTEGYRKYVVPSAPSPGGRRLVRWVGVASMGAAAAAVVLGVAIKAGLIPAFRGSTRVVSVYGFLGTAHVELGDSLPPDGSVYGLSPNEPIMTEVERQQLRAYKRDSNRPAPLPPQAEPPNDPPPAPAPDPPVVVPPPKVTPPPVPQPKPPARPPLVPPVPGTTAYLDAKAGGEPVLIFIDGRPVAYAYLLKDTKGPVMSLVAFNELFARKIYWSPDEGSGVRLLMGPRLVLTQDYRMVQDRLWLKLTPALQEVLGVRITASNASDLYFVTKSE